MLRSFIRLNQDSVCEVCLTPVLTGELVAIVGDNSCANLSCLACITQVEDAEEVHKLDEQAEITGYWK